MPVNGTLQKVCQCDPQHGNVDCSYLRVSKNLAGGLQITFMWVAQLIMGLTAYIGIVILKTGACGACDSSFHHWGHNRLSYQFSRFRRIHLECCQWNTNFITSGTNH